MLLHCGRHIHGNFLTDFPILFIIVGNSQSNITTAQNNLWSDNFIFIRIVWLGLFVRFAPSSHCIQLYLDLLCRRVVVTFIERRWLYVEANRKCRNWQMITIEFTFCWYKLLEKSSEHWPSRRVVAECISILHLPTTLKILFIFSSLQACTQQFRIWCVVWFCGFYVNSLRFNGRSLTELLAKYIQFIILLIVLVHRFKL